MDNKRICYCSRCGIRGKHVSRRTWYRHKIRYPISQGTLPRVHAENGNIPQEFESDTYNPPEQQDFDEEIADEGTSTQVHPEDQSIHQEFESDTHNPPEQQDFDPNRPSPPNDDNMSDVDQDDTQRPDPGCQFFGGGQTEEPSQSAPSHPATNTEHIDSEGAGENITLTNLAQIKELKIALDFIHCLENATLEGEKCQLNAATLKRLREPPTETLDLEDPDLLLSIKIFLATSNSSQETYNGVRKAIAHRYPDCGLLSLDQVKRRISEMTGIVPIINDMCPNTCLSYTGPFEDLEKCPKCGENRYDAITLASSNGQKKIARQEFHTVPIGPQLQALWRNTGLSQDNDMQGVRYRAQRTAQILRELNSGPNPGWISKYDDFLHGNDYIQAVQRGEICDDDMVLMFSLDGAQLYESKASDCWIYIWVIFDLSPDIRYKKRHILPGGFIPGPKKPKNVDSFLFPGLYHIAALQKEGVVIWDAARDRTFTSYPFLALATADGPGMTYLNGLVGHHGKHGCRLYCGVQGRHKPNGSHYYPALLKPLQYDIEGCDHDDIDVFNLPSMSSDLYMRRLQFLLAAPNDTQYRKRRLETGISKPSLFLGLQRKRILGLPGCFASDIMHLASLNLPNILLGLWRGTLDCDKSDDMALWEWAVLKGEIWKNHGAEVAAATPYLPGSFDRPPRNPAEKISSGYKAWEFLLYVFGLGPGLFYGILPDIYYRNFCKLVLGIRIVHQREISKQELQEAHSALIQFVAEFETIYYQRRTDRLHFVRQSIHALTHLCPEIIRIGPGGCSSQWPMERTIGNLGEEIKQPSNPFANLSQRGIQRCHINALKAMVPGLVPPESMVPKGALDLGEGYFLLRARDRYTYNPSDAQMEALRSYLQEAENSDELHNGEHERLISFHRWARLRLPNGQIARSAWKETQKPIERVRMARNVKIEMSNITFISEVQFYTDMLINGKLTGLALVSKFSDPHQGLLSSSFNMLWSSTFHGDSALLVVDVKAIRSVVAMIPHCPFPNVVEGEVEEKRFFLVEKPGLDIAHRGDNDEAIDIVS